jgi:hypothetical protein
MTGKAFVILRVGSPEDPVEPKPLLSRSDGVPLQTAPYPMLWISFKRATGVTSKRR